MFVFIKYLFIFITFTLVLFLHVVSVWGCWIPRTGVSDSCDPPGNKHRSSARATSDLSTEQQHSSPEPTSFISLRSLHCPYPHQLSYIVRRVPGWMLSRYTPMLVSHHSHHNHHTWFKWAQPPAPLSPAEKSEWSRRKTHRLCVTARDCYQEPDKSDK